ncbi:MAG: Long-chain-fatty-acid--CoA ligase [Alphaproteobacteria bacterium MarineAlpha5_Bin6]|nr:MAG: Long-chain-fatty-acid--CoA ligase [Alphaproteobacteria bacterium MarineAlpha5_Bin7]PPR53643.1 MAG: Long-chain-fatty-acid--CoA ligase [Alphaproteobacteria bacterium MarineAlpha5_Bin6]|tara:strand:+ start:60 stop:1736 length:1677 start_codon:yes stop_codon:yes gene_type:complete
MENSTIKPWLKSYPTGVSSTIKFDEFNSLIDMFEQTVERFHTKQAFTNFGVSLTFDQIHHKSSNLTSFLQNELNLSKGSIVSIMMPNLLQYPICTFGILKGGMIVENINPLYTERELETQLNNSRSETIIILENFAHLIEKIIHKTNLKNIIITSVGEMLGTKGILMNFVLRKIKKMVPKYNLKKYYKFSEIIDNHSKYQLKEITLNLEDIAFLQYTGGTSGTIKAAMLTHKNILSNVLQVKEWLGPHLKYGEDTAICALPLYHIFALTCNSLTFFNFGANNILITNPRDIKSFIKELKKHKFTFISGVNTLFNKLLLEDDFRNCDFSKLRISLAGGMQVQKNVAENWQNVTGNVLSVGYGLSETSPAASIDPIGVDKFSDSLGLPLPSTEISIQDDKGNHLKFNEPGEICIRGPQVMKGYWKNDEETNKVMTPEGWFKTGDIGIMTEKGFPKIVDRKKDMIIISGFNVYPNEIEEIAMMHENIFEAGCIGIKDNDGNEKIKLFISKVPNSTLNNQDVIQHCKKYLTGYKIPEIVEFINEIPKSNVGKILRRKLRDIK